MTEPAQKGYHSYSLQDLPGFQLYFRLLLLLTGFALLLVLELGFAGVPTGRARLWSPDFDRFGDFWHYRVLLLSIHRPVFFAAADRFAYPAPCAILFQILYHLGSHPHVTFNLILWAVEAASALVLLRAWLSRGLERTQAVLLVLLMALSSHPWHMLYDRGNIELFVYLFVALGTWAWISGRFAWAACLWAVAGAFKLYPLLLMAIFLRRERWRYFALGIACCAAILFGSFLYVGPTVRMAALGTMWGLRGFVGTYGAHSRFQELVYDHSLLAALKGISVRLDPGSDREIRLSHIYEGLLLLLGPAAFLRWRRHAPELNQLCLLLVCMVTLTPVSYDYTLIHVYLVIGIILTAQLEARRLGRPFAGWRLYALSFAVLCTTQTWMEMWWWQPNGLFKTVALISVGVLLVRHPLVRPGEALPLPAGDVAGAGVGLGESAGIAAFPVRV